MASLDWLGVLNQLKLLQLAYDRAGLVDEAAFPPGAVGCWEVACRPPPLLHTWRACFVPDCLNAGVCAADCGIRSSAPGHSCANMPPSPAPPNRFGGTCAAASERLGELEDCASRAGDCCSPHHIAGGFLFAGHMSARLCPSA